MTKEIPDDTRKAILQLLKRGMSDTECAKALGVSIATVRDVAAVEAERLKKLRARSATRLSRMARGVGYW